MTVIIPEGSGESSEEAPEVVDTGDTIVVGGGGNDSEVAIQTGANTSEIEQLKARIAELEMAQSFAPTTSEVVEIAEAVSEQVSEEVAEEVSEETAEEVAEEVAEEAEHKDSEPGGTHWLYKPAHEWRHGA